MMSDDLAELSILQDRSDIVREDLQSDPGKNAKIVRSSWSNDLVDSMIGGTVIGPMVLLSCCKSC